VVGFVVVFGVETLNGRIHPPPAGVDLADPAALRAAMADLPASALVIVLAGWALGSCIGGSVAAKFGGTRPVRNALIVGAILMAAGVTNLFMLPHPLWFNVLGLIVFLPAAWAGGRIAGRPVH